MQTHESNAVADLDADLLDQDHVDSQDAGKASGKRSAPRTAAKTPVAELERSLFVFDVNNKFRQWLFRIVESQNFVWLMVFIILLNCISIAAQFSTTVAATPWLQWLVNVSSIFFVAAFTVEMCMKTVAYGFLFAGPRSYLRNRWNLLDFAIVVLGYCTYIKGVSDYSYLRALRLVSTIKAVSALRGLRVIVISLLASLPSLGNVALLLLFMVHLFSVVFLHFFSGKLRQRCFDVPISFTSKDAAVCAFNHTQHDYGEFAVHEPLCSTSIASGRHCDPLQCCGVASASFKEIIAFENIALSWMNILMVLSGEGWTDTMYAVGDSVSKWNYVLFIALQLVGAAFCIHLITAVLFIRFEQTKADELKKYQQLAETQQLPVIAGPAGVSRPGTAASRLASRLSVVRSMTRGGNVPALRNVPQPDPGDSKQQQQAQSQELGSGRQGDYLAGGSLTTHRRLKLLPSKDGRCGVCYRPRMFVYRTVHSTRYKLFIGAMVAIYTVILALEHQQQSQTLADAILYSTHGFTAFFTLEMVFKMFGLGLRGYFSQQYFNTFECVLTVVNLVQTALTLDDMVKPTLCALQCVRLFRLLMLMDSWRSMQTLLITIWESLVDLVYFSVLLALFIFIYAITGLQILQGKMSQRSNFDDFAQAVVTVFQVMTPENWDAVLEDSFQAAGWGGGVFIVSLYLLGNYVMLNLFLAILLSNFDKNSEGKQQFEQDKLEEELSRRELLAEAGGAAGGGNEGDEFDGPHADDDDLNDGESDLRDETDQPGVELSESRKQRRKRKLKQTKSKPPPPVKQPSCVDMIIRVLCCGRSHSEPIAPEDEQEKPEPTEFLGTFPILHHEQRNFFTRKHVQIGPAHLRHSSLFFLSPTNPVRLWASKVVQHPWFDKAVLFIIVASCVLLALDSPHLDPNSLTGKAIDLGNYAVIGVFSLEFILKVIVTGFLLHPGAYLWSRWNCLDCFVLATSVISTAFPSAFGRFPRAVKALRALRPLRIISNFDHTRAVLGAVVASFVSIVNVLLLGFLLFLILAIIGVQSFRGKLSHCYMPPVTQPLDSLMAMNITECLAIGGEWRTPYDMPNFDNIGAGFLMLFELSTQENWPVFMYATIDATPYGQPPSPGYNPSAAVYFVACIFVCSLFYANLFVGAIVEGFQEHYASFNQGTGDLSPEHIKWLRVYRNILSHVPRFQLEKPPLLRERETLMMKRLGQGDPAKAAQAPPATAGAPPDPDIINVEDINIPCCTLCFVCGGEGSCWHRRCRCCTDCCHSCGSRCNEACFRPSKLWSRLRVVAYHISVNKVFDDVVIGVIMFNTAVISMSFYQEPSVYALTLQALNDACTWFYFLEWCIKMTAYGAAQFFSTRWNQVDFVVVVMSLIDFFSLSLGLFDLNAPGVNPFIFGTFRLLRFFKLLEKFQPLRELILTLRFSLPGAFHIAFLLIVLFFIYAIAGMALFGTVKYGNFIDQYGNFQDFPTAVVTLYRMTTGENWNGIMRDCMIEPPFCNLTIDCGSPSQAVTYFVSFYILATFLLLNLLIAVVLKNFENEFEEGESTVQEDSVPIISIRDITNFGKVWLRFSPTETMPAAMLPALLQQLMTLEALHERDFEPGSARSDPHDSLDPHLAVHRSSGSHSARAHGSLKPGEYPSLRSRSPSLRNNRLHPAQSAARSSLGGGPSNDSGGATAQPSEPQPVLSENEIHELIEELNIPVNPQRKTVHYIDVLYQLSLRKFRMVVVMTDTIPMDHDMVQMAKAQALRQFPSLKLHSQFPEAKKPHELLQLQKNKEAGISVNPLVPAGAAPISLSPVAIRVVAAGSVPSPVNALAAKLNASAAGSASTKPASAASASASVTSSASSGIARSSTLFERKERAARADARSELTPVVDEADESSDNVNVQSLSASVEMT